MSPYNVYSNTRAISEISCPCEILYLPVLFHWDSDKPSGYDIYWADQTDYAHTIDGINFDISPLMLFHLVKPVGLLPTDTIIGLHHSFRTYAEGGTPPYMLDAFIRCVYDPYGANINLTGIYGFAPTPAVDTLFEDYYIYLEIYPNIMSYFDDDLLFMGFQARGRGYYYWTSHWKYISMMLEILRC
jgi:hypothetical protein